MSSASYFHAANATRTYRVAGNLINFEPTGRNGSAWEGVFETDMPEIVEGLKTLESEGSVGIREIDKKTYDEIKKKAASSRSQNMIHHVQAPTFAHPDRPAAVPRVAVNDIPSPVAPPAESEKTVDELMLTGLVSEREGEESQAPKKQSRKSK